MNITNTTVIDGKEFSGSLREIISLQFADWLSKQDWKSYSMEQLEAIYGVALDVKEKIPHKEELTA